MRLLFKALVGSGERVPGDQGPARYAPINRLRRMARTGQGEAQAVAQAVQRMMRTSPEDAEPPRHVVMLGDVVQGLGLDDIDATKVLDVIANTRADYSPTDGNTRIMLARSALIELLRSMKEVPGDIRLEIAKRATAWWRRSANADLGAIVRKSFQEYPLLMAPPRMVLRRSLGPSYAAAQSAPTGHGNETHVPSFGDIFMGPEAKKRKKKDAKGARSRRRSLWRDYDFDGNTGMPSSDKPVLRYKRCQTSTLDMATDRALPEEDEVEANKRRVKSVKRAVFKSASAHSHKYKRRWRGAGGKWVYDYGESSGSVASAKSSLHKSMGGFDLRGMGNVYNIPDNLLYDYLCAFVEEAWEHELAEGVHTSSGHELQLQSVFGELVQYLPLNQNLARAAEIHRITMDEVRSILARRGLLPTLENPIDSESEPDGNEAMGMRPLTGGPSEVLLASSQNSWMQTELAARRPLSMTPAPELVSIADDSPLATPIRPRLNLGYDDGPPVVMVKSSTCQVHKDMFAAPTTESSLVKCSCKG